MTKEEIKLTEFLAWVEDNFTWIGEDEYLGAHDGTHYTREEIANQFVTTMI